MSILTGYVSVDTAILFATLLFLLYKYLTRNFNYWKERDTPFVPPKFFFGNLEDVMKLKTTIIDEFSNIYHAIKKPFFGIFIVDRPALVIKDPTLIKNILVKDFNYFINRSVHCDPSYDPIIAHVLFVSKAPNWQYLRSRIRQFFTPAKLKITTKLITEVQDSMKSYLDENHHLPNIDAKELGSSFFVDVIATCVFGIGANSFVDKNAEFKMHATAALQFTFRNALAQFLMFIVPQFAKILRVKFLPSAQNNYFRKSFLDIIAKRKETKTVRNDLIDLMIKIEDEGKNIEKDVLVAQGVMFLLAGYETSSTTLGFFLYELCLRQDIQDKLRQEIFHHKEENEELTFEAIHSMKYLQMCLSETLRKYPILPFLDRQCQQNYTIPGTNMIIEKDMTVLIPLKGLHYDHQYFPDPEKFDPERFSDENIKNIVPFSYLPFGDGPRNCIGERFAYASVKMAAITILSNFKVLRTDETSVPIIPETKTVTNGSKYGLQMKFEKLCLQKS